MSQQTPKATPGNKRESQMQSPVEEKKAKVQQTPELTPKQTNRPPLNRDDEDKKTLFVHFSSVDVKKPDVLKLSKDIKGLRMRHSWNNNNVYAYLVFDSEEAADKNYNILQGKKFLGKDIRVDYCGAKSKTPKPKSKTREIQEYDPLKLYVSLLKEEEATESFLKKAFPKCNEVIVPVPTRRKGKSSSEKWYAFVMFSSPEDCAKALAENQNHTWFVDQGFKVRKSDEDKKKKKNKKEKEKAKNEEKKPVKEAQESDDDDDNEAVDVKMNTGANKKQKTTAKQEKDDDDEDNDEEEAETKTAVAKTKLADANVKTDDLDDDESEEDDDDKDK